MPWRKSIFWRSPGKGGAHVDRLRRAASGGPSRLFAHFPLSGFLAIPFPPFFRRRSRNLPPCAMTRAFVAPKCFSMPMHWKETVDVSTARKGDFPPQRNFLPIGEPRMDLTLWKGKLDAYLDPQEGDMLRLLERIVNMDSFTTDAQDVDQLGTVLTDWLREAGFQTFMMPKTEAPADEPWQADLGHVFMAKTHGREAEPGIVFLGHMDTVFPKGTAQARPFKIEGDRATGPGVADMKAGLVANLFAARALKRLGLIDCPMTLMFSPDEELGSPSASRTLAQVLPAHAPPSTRNPAAPAGLLPYPAKVQAICS